MSRRYTDDDKSNAIAQLAANGGNIGYTSHQLNIPERTLRHWRTEHFSQHSTTDLPLPPHPPRRQQQPDGTIEGNDDDDDYSPDSEVLMALRDQIMNHIIAAAPTLLNGLILTTPYHRILALSQLLDHLERLESFIPRVARRENREDISAEELRMKMAALHARFDELQKTL